MKTLKLLSLALVAISLIGAQTGCKTKKPTNPGINAPVGGPLDPAFGDNPLGDGTGGMGLNANTPALDTFMSDPSIQSVYFAYDSSTLAAGEDAKVAAVASYLQGKPGTFVLVEGHCDERGSNEYNMGLGERRALAIRESLVTQGIGANFIVTQSYGEEKPVAMGHDESSYSQNRRGDFKFSAGQ
jgi:peptidoglycan-associated lipoprotein